MVTLIIVVAGCRTYSNYEEAKKFIDFCIFDIRKRYNLILFRAIAKVLTNQEKNMQKKMVFLWNIIQLNGINTVKVQDL